MTDKEEQIAFEQWIEDHGQYIKGISKDALWQVYRSMDEENRLEFLEKAKKAYEEYEREMYEEYEKEMRKEYEEYKNGYKAEMRKEYEREMRGY